MKVVEIIEIQVPNQNLTVCVVLYRDSIAYLISIIYTLCYVYSKSQENCLECFVCKDSHMMAVQ